VQRILFTLLSLLSFTFSNAQFDPWPSPTEQTLRDVHFFDANNGVVVGDSGIILRTDNGGVSWNFALAIDSIRLTTVKFFDRNNGIALGDQLFRTTDGGISWSRIQHPNTEFFDIEILDNNTCVISGAPKRLIKSTDQGASFFTLVDESPPFYPVHLSFVNDSVGYSCNGTNQLYYYVHILHKTVDGGQTWSGPIASLPKDDIHELTFLAEDTALVSGYPNYLAKTFDGGLNHQIAQSTDSSFLTNVQDFHFDPDYPQAYFACGWHGAYKSTDQGLSWNSINFNVPIGDSPILFGIFFIDDQTGWAVGSQGGIYKTFNGGIVNREEASLTDQEWITFYPNPSAGVFEYECKKPGLNPQIIVYNAMGQLLMESQGSITEIDLSAYPSGTYWVKVETRSQTLFHRLIKE